MAASTVSTQHSSQPTYAQKTKGKIQPIRDFNYPDEDQAIIFDHHPDTKILDYLKAFLPLLSSAKNITAASRVSGNRVIVFFDTKDRVTELLNSHPNLTLDGKKIALRRLKTPSLKVVLSNVSPAIPNSVLEDFLKSNFKVEFSSIMSFLRVSPTDEIFSHVISWCRQIYIKNVPDLKLPPFFTVSHNERSYRIFITHDEFTCYKCKKTGHKADDCKSFVNMEDEYNLFGGNNAEVSSAMPISPTIVSDT